MVVEISQGLEGTQVGGRGQLTGALSGGEKPSWANACPGQLCHQEAGGQAVSLADVSCVLSSRWRPWAEGQSME